MSLKQDRHVSLSLSWAHRTSVVRDIDVEPSEYDNVQSRPNRAAV